MPNVSGIIRICAIITGILLLSCITHLCRPKPTEVAIFTTLGNRPFSDSISTVWPDGSRVERLLSPKGRKSYLSASGNSLIKVLVVTVYESVSNNKKENHLFLYEPTSGNWRRLVMKEGAEG